MVHAATLELTKLVLGAGVVGVEQDHDLVTGIPPRYNVAPPAGVAEGLSDPAVHFPVAKPGVHPVDSIDIDECHGTNSAWHDRAHLQEGAASPHPEWSVPPEILQLPFENLQLIAKGCNLAVETKESANQVPHAEPHTFFIGFLVRFHEQHGERRYNSPMTAGTILTIYVVLFVVQHGWETSLSLLNLRHIGRHATGPPAVVADRIDEQTFSKSVEYSRARNRYTIVASIASALAVFVLVVSGALGAVERFVTSRIGSDWLESVLYVFAIGAIVSLLQLPFSIYRQFVLEERFGFNRTNIGLFLIDRVKSTVVSIVLLGPLLLMLFWLMDRSGQFWWLYAFAAIAIYQLVVVVLYPTVISPWFNRFTPLEDEQLRVRLLTLAEHLGFRVSGIFVMDGSRRSRHSNAYFTGVGPTKRIVLFDTLVSSLEPAELEGVLAHEIGHEKLAHIRKGLLASLFSALVGLWILAQLLGYGPFFAAFGFAEPSYHAAVVLMAFCSGPFTFILTPLFAIWSRRNEYAADRFAIDATGSRDSLKGALLVLSRDNLSNLSPHPWYSFYHYSHPTLVERLEAMDAHTPSRDSPNAAPATS